MSLVAGSCNKCHIILQNVYVAHLYVYSKFEAQESGFKYQQFLGRKTSDSGFKLKKIDTKLKQLLARLSD